MRLQDYKQLKMSTSSVYLDWVGCKHTILERRMARHSAKLLLSIWCLIVIQLAAILRVPDDAPAKLPTDPDVCTLGPLSAIREEPKTKSLVTITEFKHKGKKERHRREKKGWVTGRVKSRVL